tara:strand:+ start:41 stop:679 length:639 start_codon:yes stop_codon:yes gene_type:complete
MRYSLKRLLLEQTSINKEQQEQEISNLITQSGGNVSSTAGEDIVAVLMGGENLNRTRKRDFPFADVEADGVFYNVKGTDKAQINAAYNNADLKPTSWEDFKKQPDVNTDKVGLVLISAIDAGENYEVTIKKYGPFKEDAMDEIFFGMGDKSKRPVQSKWGVADETKYSIPKTDDSNLVSGIRNALRSLRSGKTTIPDFKTSVSGLVKQFISN